MATTTNYSWTTPDDTALVKDGAAAIRSLGTAIDSTVFTNAGAAIAKTIVDAKGDIIAATAADTVSRLAVGADGTVLTAASGQATGLEWATVSAGSNWSLLNSGGTALTGAATITVSGISGKDKIMILVDSASTTGSNDFTFRFNTDTGSNYYNYGGVFVGESDAAASVSEIGEGRSNVIFAKSAGTSSTASGYCLLTGCNSSGVKVFSVGGGSTSSGLNSGQKGYTLGGYYDSSSTISSISVFSTSTNFDAGTVYVYTSA
jgi:hypothetical protein